jgi:hypothetical protein
MMNDSKQQLSWLSAIHRAANEQKVALPPFTDRGMGSAICRSTTGDRFASVKRRLVSAQEAANAGVEWTLWRENDATPVSVAVFREPLHPAPEDVSFILAALKGWLIDDWTVETAQQHAERLATASVANKRNGTN